MSEIWSIYSTFATRDEAILVARALVESNLVACANIHDNITSIYRWDGQLQQENEVALIAKTSKKTLQKAMEAIKRLHSYEIPCILATQLDGGYPAYLDWIKRETT
ncbi:MAG: divalent-cation tolerance protein CutA [Rickettsiales bacterium]|jgi:periplasmic divalent cation tolerance protein|nr:divalent-cation tolerance protein CutA [Rickettsiales bacterium]